MPDDEAQYVCGACGEEIVVSVDVSAGDEQDYVEDCPVCCRPNRLRVRVDARGNVTLESELE